MSVMEGFFLGMSVGIPQAPLNPPYHGSSHFPVVQIKLLQSALERAVDVRKRCVVVVVVVAILVSPLQPQLAILIAHILIMVKSHCTAHLASAECPGGGVVVVWVRVGFVCDDVSLLDKCRKMGLYTVEERKVEIGLDFNWDTTRLERGNRVDYKLLKYSSNNSVFLCFSMFSGDANSRNRSTSEMEIQKQNLRLFPRETEVEVKIENDRWHDL
ncbi:hypothetical protein EDB84DRAFT_1445886 [Lactarius hengduanensis]|nr:hypothetical protein EDB84DRAFT_1445886 [Lactarius hengduanensis]